MTKKHIGILFGGKSVEHEISLLSARNVFDNIDKDLFDVSLIGIDQNGKWYLNQAVENTLEYNSKSQDLALNFANDETNFLLPQTQQYISFDAIFPVLHGTFGEDGTVQGLLRVANIPFVGPDVLGSAVCMDKIISKRLLKEANVPISKFIQFDFSEKEKINFEELIDELGLPMMVKPANLGSSVGMNKANNKEEFESAVKEVFKFDNQIIFEEFIEGRELECAIMGNENPKATVPGEVILNKSKHEFYSYEAKYLDPDGAKIQIPAYFSENIIYEIKKYSIAAYKALNCEVMARIDLFVTIENQVLVNEVNTIPGFTSISMFPKLWEYEGINYKDLITKLINLAIERHQKRNRTSLIKN